MTVDKGRCSVLSSRVWNVVGDGDPVQAAAGLFGFDSAEAFLVDAAEREKNLQQEQVLAYVNAYLASKNGSGKFASGPFVPYFSVDRIEEAFAKPSSPAVADEESTPSPKPLKSRRAKKQQERKKYLVSRRN